jgi:uncharacterized protein
MAPASSAQREPSMEEILASIRRIIEDSDTAQKRPDEPAVHFPANEQPLAAAKAEVEAFRAELRPVPEIVLERRPMTPPVARPVTPPVAESAVAPARISEPAQMTELPHKAFRPAEVQAQVSGEAAAQPKAPESEKRPVTLAEVQQLAKEPAAAAAPAILSVAPMMAASPTMDTSAVPAAEASPETPGEPVALDLRREEPLPKADVAAAPASEAAPKPAIISPLAGRQVAAAFGELSEAFAARSKKTFDDLAEQMLRPMLQDWLDNNLPILVERLVREEIERVARGVE